MNIFTIIIISISACLLIAGAILLKKNVRPILGFLLLIAGLALFIGITMDPKGFHKEVTSMVRLISK